VIRKLFSISEGQVKSENFRIIVIVIILAGILPLRSVGADNGSVHDRRLDMGVFIQDYRWAEYGDDGPRLLEETGNLFGIAADYASSRKKIGWRGGARLFAGDVEYDGQTWSELPVTTDVFYFGAKGYADAVPGYRLDAGLWLKSFIGLGSEAWLRDLADTRTPDGASVSGAREWWGCVYGRMGLGAEYPVAETLALFAEAGVKLPIYARNEANFLISGSPSAGLEPEMDFSGFGHAGFRWKQWGARAAYDSLRFDRSDAVSSGGFTLYQPKSKSEVYSIEIFWSPDFW